MTPADLKTAAARPPYRLALLAALVVLAGYVVSLAPTVTFWDAGEFITAAHTLGVPHPPGTPVFVIIGRAWDALIPGLPTALKMNLMSATFSAAAAGFLFLLVHQALERGAAGMDPGAARLFRVGGAFAATLIAAFGFTVWQNSNETEVYQVAMFSIAVIGWCCWLWRRDRRTRRGARLLLLIVYLFGVALGNHLMALLAGPAVLWFLLHVLREKPAAAAEERRAQWAELLVVGSLWVAMVGVGTGNAAVIVVGLTAFAAAAVQALRARTALFAVAALGVAAAGITTYAFLFVRAGLQPVLNIADPSTPAALWDVIRRAQYPVRTPLDSPLYLHGPDNPGRTLQLFGLQLLNYLQYFDWQWSAGLQAAREVFAPARLPFTLLFAALGAYGAARHRAFDRATFQLFLLLFLTAGVALVVYLNFKPGFSIGRAWFPDAGAREVRERDYFFTASFVMWGLWAGMGLAAAFRALRERLGAWRPGFAAPVFAAALLPFALNFAAAGRRHPPTAELARDFAYDLLQSVEPYGILFTGGDNDQYPLWYLQEVEGVRRDVQLVNLSLINTDWYMRQLRDSLQRFYRPDSAALRLYGELAPAAAPGCTPAQARTLAEWARSARRHLVLSDRESLSCLHSLSDAQVAGLVGQYLPADFVFRTGRIVTTYPTGTPFQGGQIAQLRIIQENAGRRPVHFAITAGPAALLGLDPFVSLHGLTYRLNPDSVRAGVDTPNVGLGVLDLERTRRLAWDVYRYARLFDADTLVLDPTSRGIAGSYYVVFAALAEAARQRGDRRELLANLRRAYHLFPDPDLRDTLRRIEQGT